MKEAQEEESPPEEEMVVRIARGPAEPGVSKDHCLEYGLPGWTWLFRALRAPVMIKAPTISMQGLEGPSFSWEPLSQNGLMADLC